MTLPRLTILESCGLTFAHIPLGNYPVGAVGKAILARPPQIDFFIPPMTPPQTITSPGFTISTEPLRWSHWQKITAHPELNIAGTLLSAADITHVQSCVVAEDRVEIEPTAGDRQMAFANSERLEPGWLPQQVEPDPVVEVGAATAAAIAGVLKTSLPHWTEWEIAMRGPKGYLYPWGDTLDTAQLSLEHQDYSVDEESVMGYYSYNQNVYFIHSFEAYANRPSPFGLTGLSRPGREWNLSNPALGPDYILRSVSDLGSMAWMIPGIRPNTWGFAGWHNTKKHRAFSGPALPCYARADKVYDTGGFRLVIQERGQP